MSPTKQSREKNHNHNVSSSSSLGMEAPAPTTPPPAGCDGSAGASATISLNSFRSREATFFCNSKTPKMSGSSDNSNDRTNDDDHDGIFSRRRAADSSPPRRRSNYFDAATTIDDARRGVITKSGDDVRSAAASPPNERNDYNFLHRKVTSSDDEDITPRCGHVTPQTKSGTTTIPSSRKECRTDAAVAPSPTASNNSSVSSATPPDVAVHNDIDCACSDDNDDDGDDYLPADANKARNGRHRPSALTWVTLVYQETTLLFALPPTEQDITNLLTAAFRLDECTPVGLQLVTNEDENEVIVCPLSVLCSEVWFCDVLSMVKSTDSSNPVFELLVTAVKEKKSDASPGCYYPEFMPMMYGDRQQREEVGGGCYTRHWVNTYTEEDQESASYSRSEEDSSVEWTFDDEDDEDMETIHSNDSNNKECPAPAPSLFPEGLLAAVTTLVSHKRIPSDAGTALLASWDSNTLLKAVHRHYLASGDMLHFLGTLEYLVTAAATASPDAASIDPDEEDENKVIMVPEEEKRLWRLAGDEEETDLLPIPPPERRIRRQRHVPSNATGSDPVKDKNKDVVIASKPPRPPSRKKIFDTKTNNDESHGSNFANTNGNTEPVASKQQRRGRPPLLKSHRGNESWDFALTNASFKDAVFGRTTGDDNIENDKITAASKKPPHHHRHRRRPHIEQNDVTTNTTRKSIFENEQPNDDRHGGVTTPRSEASSDATDVFLTELCQTENWNNVEIAALRLALARGDEELRDVIGRYYSTADGEVLRKGLERVANRVVTSFWDEEEASV